MFRPITILGAITLAIAAAFILYQRPSPPKQKAPWKIGFWIWSGAAPATASIKPDILYVQAQGRDWPRKLPDAEEYMAVRRIEPNFELTKAAAAALAQDFKALTQSAGSVRLVGLQIDYDCPTRNLASYGRFLRWVRQGLPAGSRLSITALLDWFEPGTAIRTTLSPVDEFVPQFYDAGPARVTSGIAEPIDAAKWAPILNAYGTPYRIGISSFGRVARRRIENGETAVHFFRDATPMEFAGRREFRRSTERTPADELVVRYDVAEPVPTRPTLKPGDVVEITFPTEPTVRTAYQAALRFGGYASGVLFFRWPNTDESLPLTPAEVARIVRGESLTSEAQLETRDGQCLERRCADLHLHLGRKPDGATRTVVIGASGPIELFLPDGPLRPSLGRGNRIFVNVPAYSGLESVYLGRAISDKTLGFEVLNP
jgi:hypothetical protein